MMKNCVEYMQSDCAVLCIRGFVHLLRDRCVWLIFLCAAIKIGSSGLLCKVYRCSVVRCVYTIYLNANCKSILCQFGING